MSRNRRTRSSSDRTDNITISTERFHWRNERGETKEMPLLRALDIESRRRYVYEFEKYLEARKTFFRAMGYDDPSMIGVTNGITPEVRESIITAAAISGVLIPEMRPEHRPIEGVDFDDESSDASRAKRKGIEEWIALRGIYVTDSGRSRGITIEAILSTAGRPDWKRQGTIVAITNYFEEVKRVCKMRMTTALKQQSDAARGLYRQIVERDADRFRHPLIGVGDKVRAGMTWREAVYSRSLGRSPPSEKNLESARTIILQEVAGLLRNWGRADELSTYHRERRERGDNPKREWKRKRERGENPKRESKKQQTMTKAKKIYGKLSAEQKGRLQSQVGRDWKTQCACCGSTTESCGGIANTSGGAMRSDWRRCNRALDYERSWDGYLWRALLVRQSSKRIAPTTTSKSQGICFAYQKDGKCKWGSKCRFQHRKRG